MPNTTLYEVRMSLIEKIRLFMPQLEASRDQLDILLNMPDSSAETSDVREDLRLLRELRDTLSKFVIAEAARAESCAPSGQSQMIH